GMASRPCFRADNGNLFENLDFLHQFFSIEQPWIHHHRPKKIRATLPSPLQSIRVPPAYALLTGDHALSSSAYPLRA
ncbi:hypothetical protein, partial [Methylococcus capsulatus]|uniref:hypothetical protein n=1 Tax=Methylococcus capsulatus TaxID=414 RepID=UPI001B7F8169